MALAEQRRSGHPAERLLYVSVGASVRCGFLVGRRAYPSAFSGAVILDVESDGSSVGLVTRKAGAAIGAALALEQCSPAAGADLPIVSGRCADDDVLTGAAVAVIDHLLEPRDRRSSD